MQIERHYINEIKIEDFADEHGLVMEVHERRVPSCSQNRFYAHFKDAEVKDGSCLSGIYGDGASVSEAIKNYARKISLQTLIVGAYTDARKTLIVPRLVIDGKPHP